MYESLTLEHTSTVERAAQSLRQALFAGDLAPGTPLREVAIADQLDVARSTVREALALLAGEGLVTRIPNRGVVVSGLDADQIHDVMRARLVLESAGARAWPVAQEVDRDAVRDAMAAYRARAEEGAPTPDLTEAHLLFHRSLVALTASTRLITVSEQLCSEIRLALAHVDRLRENARGEVAGHQALLDRLEAGDHDGVAKELVVHLQGAEEALNRYVARSDGATTQS